MTKYATFGPDGILNGRYDSDINTVIPEQAAQITDAQFIKSINDRTGYLELVNGTVTWTVPPPIPLPQKTAEEMIAAAHLRINVAYESAVNAMTAGYPENEIASWPKQEREARAWVADSTASTPWIDAAAGTRGIAKPVFANLIITLADALAPAHGQLTGKRQLLRDQINALGANPSQAELDAIQW